MKTIFDYLLVSKKTRKLYLTEKETETSLLCSIEEVKRIENISKKIGGAVYISDITTPEEVLVRYRVSFEVAKELISELLWEEEK